MGYMRLWTLCEPPAWWCFRQVRQWGTSRLPDGSTTDIFIAFFSLMNNLKTTRGNFNDFAKISIPRAYP
jgi:hypothetical protein